MNILLFHAVQLPPQHYGGVERVMLWLAKGLVERGHRVRVAAFGGSILPMGVELVPIDRRQRSASVLLEPGVLPDGTEIVHFMAPQRNEILHNLPCPSILTVHGNGQPGETFPRNSVFLSQDHARRHNATTFVYNGIDPSEYVFRLTAHKEAWYLFLSKTSWSVKNLAGAMRLCKSARVPLKIAGGRRPFRKRLAAFFDPSVRWIGPVGGQTKAELLSFAKALLFPVVWPEPFGLVVVEALVSGTPVLSTPMGSLRELVPPDVGALLGTDEEWLETLSRDMLPWSGEKCRQWALDNFHYRKMSEAYERLYFRVCSGEVLHDHNPATMGRDGNE